MKNPDRYVIFFMLFMLTQYTSSALAYNSSLPILPTEKISIVIDDFNRLFSEIASSGKLDFNNKIEAAKLLKEISIAAFEDNGFSYIKTLKKIATKGFGYKNKAEFMENSKLPMKLISIFGMPGMFLEDSEKIDLIHTKQEQKYIETIISRVDNDMSLFINE